MESHGVNEAVVETNISKQLKEIESKINKGNFNGISYQEARNLLDLSSDSVFYLWSLAERIHLPQLAKKDLCGSLYADLKPCPEDCRFCPLSKNHFKKNFKARNKIESISNEIINFSNKAEENGLSHFKIVVTGLSIRKDIYEEIKKGIKEAKNKHPNIKICISGGIIEKSLLEDLKSAGIDIYNNNLEASRIYYSKLVSSHSIEQKIRAIKNAIKVGLKVCCGGIIGMGETMEDRIALAFEIKKLGIYSSPINLFVKYKVLPLSKEIKNRLSEEEILNTLAIFRLINPKVRIVLGAGRDEYMSPFSKKIALMIGASAFQASGYFSKSGFSETIESDSNLFGDILNGKH